MDEHVAKALPDALVGRGVDAARVQNVGLRATPDPDILAWAAATDRLVVTSDRDTMPGFAYGRAGAGLPVAGVVVLNESLAFGVLVKVFTEYTLEEILDQVVVFLPLVRRPTPSS